MAQVVGWLRIMVFTVSTGGSLVLGFSLSGSVIPGGSSGVLTNLAYEATGSEACFFKCNYIRS